MIDGFVDGSFEIMDCVVAIIPELLRPLRQSIGEQSGLRQVPDTLTPSAASLT